MTPRQRELTAIRHGLPDRVPADVICIEITDRVAEYLRIEPVAVYERLGIDGRIVAASYLGQLPAPVNGVSFSEWGTPNTGDYGTGRRNPLAAAATLAEIERYPWPDPASYDFAGAAKRAGEWGATYAVRGPYWQPLFCRVCDLFGMEEAMVRMVTQPVIFEAALERVCDHVAKYCAHLLDACGDALPILCLGDDFATQRGLMISPELWRKLLKPRLARLFAVGKKRGKLVWFHSCGDITSILPDLIEIGVDLWETVQLHTLPLSPRHLKREFGRDLAFFGAINTQHLPYATPDEVRAEVRRTIESLGRDGGYICGPDHHVKPDVPPANVVALFETVLSFRAKGYTAPWN